MMDKTELITHRDAIYAEKFNRYIDAVIKGTDTPQQLAHKRRVIKYRRGKLFQATKK